MEEEQIVPIPLSISVFETIAVSEWLIVGIVIERIIHWDFNPKQGESIVSIAEYRQILGDNTNKDKDIARRLQYLEAYCRNIIKWELQSYGKW